MKPDPFDAPHDPRDPNPWLANYLDQSTPLDDAVKRAYAATPEPKLVVAVGDCGCTGGIFGESYASCGRVANVIPVDVNIPGCPPTPLQLMQGILAAIAPDTAKDDGK